MGMYDEGSSLDASAFVSVFVGQFSLPTQLIKLNIRQFDSPSPLTQLHHGFFREISPVERLSSYLRPECYQWYNLAPRSNQLTYQLLHSLHSFGNIISEKPVSLIRNLRRNHSIPRIALPIC